MLLQWFDLFARIIKVILLSAVYSTVLFFILFLVFKHSKSGLQESLMRRPFWKWVMLHILISAGLFAFSFSYWQDTGLGEAPQLPIGYGQVVYSPDFAHTSFFPDLYKKEWNKDELGITDFNVSNDFLCATVSHFATDSPTFDFIAYDLRKKQMTTFANEQEYLAFAKSKNLPLPAEFYDFTKHYEEFFAKKPKWQKWLLP